jgi:hypothetical protein
MGLLDALLPGSPIAKFADNNQNLLGAIGSGLARGTNFGQGLSYAAQLAPQARALDAQVQQQGLARNQTVQLLEQKAPDIAEYVKSGALTPAQGLQQLFAQNKPMVVSPGSTVLEGGKPVYTAPAAPRSATASFGQTPIIFTDPNDTIHLGQMSNAGGVLIDGKTYSSLPPGWKVGTVSQSGSGGLSPEALDILSTQYLAGDKSAIQGFSRNATMRSQIANAIAAKANAMGMDGKAIAADISAYGGNVAAQRAAGTRAAQVGMAASEADKMADIALQASDAVPRGAVVPWNALQNAVRTGTSSPEMAAFVTATTSLVNAYARAVSPLGAPTDAMRQHAEQMLNTAQSPEAYKAVIMQMKREMDAALNAPAEISNQLKSNITGAPTPAAAGGMSGTTASGTKWSVSP